MGNDEFSGFEVGCGIAWRRAPSPLDPAFPAKIEVQFKGLNHATMGLPVSKRCPRPLQPHFQFAAEGCSLEPIPLPTKFSIVPIKCKGRADEAHREIHATPQRRSAHSALIQHMTE